jgi:4-hydroxy-2-oxoheptanedioate aldolase
MSIGCPGEGASPEVRAAERRVIETALKKGLHPRAEIRDPESAKRFLEMGVKHFCIGWDVSILHGFWKENGAAMQALLAGSAKSKKARKTKENYE